MTKKRLLYGFILSLIALALVACERQKIGDITADPGRFNGKEVAVAGRVIQSVGALGKGVYEIDDGTGKLWVWSETRGVPSKGAYVGVKGRIAPTVTFLGINYATVMRETDRRAARGD
jgi:RecJ-like exonuclease